MFGFFFFFLIIFFCQLSLVDAGRSDNGILHYKLTTWCGGAACKVACVPLVQLQMLQAQQRTSLIGCDEHAPAKKSARQTEVEKLVALVREEIAQRAGECVDNMVTYSSLSTCIHVHCGCSSDNEVRVAVGTLHRRITAGEPLKVFCHKCFPELAVDDYEEINLRRGWPKVKLAMLTPRSSAFVGGAFADFIREQQVKLLFPVTQPVKFKCLDNPDHPLFAHEAHTYSDLLAITDRKSVV